MAADRTRVLHLTGSPVDDFHADISLLYARDCLEATADEDRYEFVVAHVHPGDVTNWSTVPRALVSCLWFLPLTMRAVWDSVALEK